MKAKGQIIILAILALLFPSCGTTVKVTSQKALNESITKCNRDLSEAGFRMTGNTFDDKNDLYVEGVSYSTQTGYGTAMGNSYSVRQTYSFATEDNRTLTYTVSYKPHTDYVHYVTDVSIVGCNASNSNDYRRYCGEVAKITQLPKDIDLHTNNRDKTEVGCISIVALFGGLLVGGLLYTISY